MCESPTKINLQMEDEQFESIVCMNITESKFYVYQHNGILISRYDFSNDIKSYGEIKAISPNGKYMVLKKTEY